MNDREKIDIEFFEEFLLRIQKINQTNIENLVLYKNGKEVDLSKERKIFKHSIVPTKDIIDKHYKNDLKKMSLPEKIILLMKDHLRNNPGDYINPHLLSEINKSLRVHYEIEDDELDNLIMNMWEM